MANMIHPFTRFDFKFGEHKVAADYEDIDGILYFTFKVNDQIEFSMRLLQFKFDEFVEIDRLHYGEKMVTCEVPRSLFKGTGLPAACVEQIMRKHPEIRFAIRSEISNPFALRLAEKLARENLYVIVF